MAWGKLKKERAKHTSAPYQGGISFHKSKGQHILKNPLLSGWHHSPKSWHQEHRCNPWDWSWYWKPHQEAPRSWQDGHRRRALSSHGSWAPTSLSGHPLFYSFEGAYLDQVFIFKIVINYCPRFLKKLKLNYKPLRFSSFFYLHCFFLKVDVKRSFLLFQYLHSTLLLLIRWSVFLGVEVISFFI